MIHRTLEISTKHLSAAAMGWLTASAMISAIGRETALLAATRRGWLVQVLGRPCSAVARLQVLLERRQVLVEAPGLGRHGAELIERFDRAIDDTVTTPPDGMPADLWRCLARAAAEDCRLVLFDDEAPTLDWPEIPYAGDALRRCEAAS
ncbi:hypothetical protein OOZ54_12735 [Rhodopseudomonas palustris]|uniref:DUF5983 family protein n=1 Tax=Rhodopseudomonas palustris TaxID=1076 RepID=UPI0022F0DB2D|nr:hypothetical protein [Rhodopseudomonas palustris]WBU27561.1 hypothetical protein OOZ54_12735 [Rhodopseudomonas palustris]